ncbi:protein phosphatase Slingshot homolog 2 isoform X2 [Heteronotia binoei]|uniref:protein phosphatase Slingshot homolog 2 isoform X2 n=1 Tax=Heteronotia binoei TaxID=13085 RepID=UPI0029304F31|nr:protein phosphatase Slingshot homolog 2 isoform X2 [Heteronotia binoei]
MTLRGLLRRLEGGGGRRPLAPPAGRRRCSSRPPEMIPYFSADAVISQNAINQLISESFLTVKGAALFLPRGNGSSTPRISHRRNKHAGDLQQHLQAMFMLLRPEDNIRLAVRLESTYQNRTRYMVVVSTNGRQDTEESIVLGMDFSSNDSMCTMGLVLPLWSDALIHLDGDGGFSVSTDNRVHIFKPVSVQAMWSALQSLHKACEVARINNYYPGSLFLTWVSYYESHINSDQSSVNEWNAMQDVQSHRPDSPALFTDVPTERERTERLIKTKLREIMMQKDLENITSKEIRTELEMQMACNLREFKEFIDNEMIVILGQMDSPTQIFDHVFLGSEWNASNLEDLQNRGVRYILNVTREIDNFFPGIFEYHNIRVYDEEATDLLAYWNDTYKFISKAKKNGSKCLVHCKMGVSRSASTVIAYAMKEYGWNLDRAYDYVKERRTVTKPNPSFMRQLEEYQGILLASKQRHNKLWRSHSDSDLSDHHEPIGKSGMEVSKKEITTSADQISDNKTPNSLHSSASPGAGPPTECRCHLGANAMEDFCRRERVIQLEITSRDFSTEQMEDKLNLNSINGCPSGCCLDDPKFPLDNCRAPEAMLQHGEAFQVAAEFPDLAVDDLEKDALKQGDGSVHLVPVEELESCLHDLPKSPNRNSPSPPFPSQPESTDFSTDRIDFFSALEKFVELSQEGRSRAFSHSRTEDQGGGRNGLPKVSALELLPSDPVGDAPRSNSTGNSPLMSEASSAEEEHLKLSELDHLSGLTRSHSENSISVKEIVTEIESIHQGVGQGAAKMDSLNNQVPASKRNTVHELPAESVWAWENKSGKAEQGEGVSVLQKETARESLKLDQESTSVLQTSGAKLESEESDNLPEDPPETRLNPGPKWCPGSVRRATLEFEERLRQEQELQHASPIAPLPARKNSKIESVAAADVLLKGKDEEPSHEPAQISRDKESTRAGNTGTEAGSEQPPVLPISPLQDDRSEGSRTEELGFAREHRTVVLVEGNEKIPAPCLLPKRIEIIEYTHVARSSSLPEADLPTAEQSPEPEVLEKASVIGTVSVVDENCNAPSCSENPVDLVGAACPLLRPSILEHRDFKKAVFSLGSPEEEGIGALMDTEASQLANRANCPPAPHLDRLPHQHFVCLEGVTQNSTSSDPEPAPSRGYAGNGQFAFEERGGAAVRRRSEGAVVQWSPGDLNVPHKLDPWAGGAPEATSATPLCCGLPHSSSSDSIQDLSGSPGSVKQRAKEMEARIRQAGLTPPSHMKRSASLAKLGCLDLLKDDLSCRDALSPSPSSLDPLPAICGQKGPTLASEHSTQGPGATLLPSVPQAPQLTVHFVEPLKTTERVALSKPVERPPAQYAKEFSLTRPLSEAKLTSGQAAGLPGLPAPPRLAVVPRYQHGRTRLPRRLKKANDRKRTTNPLYNTM